MKELQNIIETFKQSKLTDRRTALATVVKTSGSVYRRPGARMLITDDGQTIGAISGGCLESNVFERSQPLMFYSGEPLVVQYDTTSSDDIVWGFGLGCNGVVNVLIESLADAFASNQLEFIAECFLQYQSGAIATIFDVKGETQVKVASRLFLKQDGAVTNNIKDRELAQKVLQDAREVLTNGRSRVASYSLVNGRVEVLLEVIQPPLPLLVFGAGYDAIPVVNCAKQLGWHVTVIDNRPGYTTRDRFPNADDIIFCDPENLKAHLSFNSHMVAVVMTHKYLHDLELLRTLLLSPLKYIGLLGPKTRRERLLQDLQASGFMPTPDQLLHLYSPVGLDIGANTPEEIALSIVAEIQAVVACHSGSSLRERTKPIHSQHDELTPLVSI
ncbi:XdhC/CoxI family protein [Scytonema sp. UIC 10036]|uniref:XdhC family protein n=1 Tax=Scytonema sp. UIC 10036 TaxID=2304196 RepID=UPI0012DA59E3|nr:XdhC/CoxI family protein [Scytonema sp. UIC 10036]MUG95582.1 XdhC/CoxI family protein [Scytonema sp. UIC 10036]